MTTTHDTISTAEEAALRFALTDLGPVSSGVADSWGRQMDRLREAQLSPNAKKHHAPPDPLSLSEMPIKSTGNADWTTRRYPPEEWADWSAPTTIGGMRKESARRAYEALAALARGGREEQRALRVLNLVLGPRPPGVDRSWLFGHLWPIAVYTEVVEARRRELVRQEVDRQHAHAQRAARAHNEMVDAWERSPDGAAPPQHIHLSASVIDRMRRSAERMVTPGDALRDLFESSGAQHRELVEAQAEALYADARALFAKRLREVTAEAKQLASARARRVAADARCHSEAFSQEPPAPAPRSPVTICAEDVERLLATSRTTARRIFDDVSEDRPVFTIVGHGRTRFITLDPPKSACA